MKGNKARKRRFFTPEFKADTVRLVLEEGRSIPELCRDLGLTETSVRTWVRQARIDARIDAGKGQPGALTTTEKEELARLRRENRELRMERDLLKKATAFFARESK